MEKRILGNSGLRVSRLGLGTMTWGRDTDEHEAADQLKTFIDAGGNVLVAASSQLSKLFSSRYLILKIVFVVLNI